MAVVGFLLLGLLPCCDGSAWAAGWELGARLQSAGGWDSNPAEATASHDGDNFYRAQAEFGVARNFQSPFARRAEFTVRGFDERYVDLPAEHRAQVELRLRLDQNIGRRGGSGKWEFATRTRTYPDSTRRSFSRERVQWDGRFRLGPRGTLRPSFSYDQIDLRVSDQDDRRSLEVGLGYDWRLAPSWVAFGGLDLGGARYDRPSIRELLPEEPPVFGPNQSDDRRRARLGLRYVGRTVVQVEYGYLSQSSNSLGASYRRHELRWIVSRALALGVRGQFFGNVESTHYSDAELEDFELFLLGEELEARDDNNLVAVQLTRSVGERLGFHVRHTWFRNETFLVGTFYRKSIWSAGLTWQLGRLSGF